jgi:hypothetical protein
MDPVMTGTEPEGHLVTLVATLAVMPDPSPVLGWPAHPEVEVGAADRLE